MLCRRELQIDLPLQVLIKHDAAPVLFAEGVRLGRVGVLVRRRPVGPDPEIGIAAVQIFVERAIGGEALEQVALAFAEGSKLARARRPAAPFAQKLRERELQEAQFQRAHPLVFHKRRGAQASISRVTSARSTQCLSRARQMREILHALHIQIEKFW